MGNSVNAHIHQYLTSYLKRENPQYAVMLNGAWGCGKTFFIRKWKESIKSKDIKPIYVSLFGLQTVKEINELINKELHPILTSKATKTIIKTAKVLTGVAISHKLGNDESEMNYSIDLTSLLETDNPKTVGGKIIIFDDMERCHIPPHLLLGYINYFVEICNCHVILVCNNEKLCSWEGNGSDKKYKDEFRIFEEKTIGIKLTIQPSISEALDFFISETKYDPKDFLNRYKKDLALFIRESAILNLRSVRQAIFDFTDIIRVLDDTDRNSSEYDTVAKDLLFNMIAFYQEARANNYAFVNWQDTLCRFNIGDKKNEKYEEYNKALNKYRSISLFGLRLFGDIVDKVIWPKFKTGQNYCEYIKNQLHKPIRKPWEILLHDMTELSNEEFNNIYEQVIDAFSNHEFLSANEIIPATYAIVEAELYGIRSAPQDFCKVIDSTVSALFDKMKNEADFYNLYGTYKVAIQYYSLDSKKSNLWNHFKECFNNNFESRIDSFRNEFTMLLETLTDDDIDKIKNLEFSPAPGVNKTEYHRYSIFKNADQDKVVESIMKLSNKSLHIYWEWLLLRYEVSWNSGSVDNASLHGDINALRIIQSGLVIRAQNCTNIQKFNLERIIKVMNYVCQAYEKS